MSDFKIKEITFYSFLFLIIGLVLTSGILYFSLNKIKDLNKKLSILTQTQNRFLEMYIESDSILTTIDLSKKKKDWNKIVLEFDKTLKNNKISNKSKFEELWYVTKKEIEEINKILEKEIFLPQNLQQKSILTLKGEMFVLKEQTENYNTLIKLIRKIEYLNQYENVMFKKFKKVYTKEKEFIDKQINRTVYFTIIFILLIILTIIAVIGILNKKIGKIEFKLINTQNNLENKILEIKESRFLLQNIIDSIPASVFWKDTHNRYMGVNKYFLQNAGVKEHSDVIGKTDYDMPWTKEEAESFIEDDNKVLKTSKPKLHFEEKITTNDGLTLTVLTSKVPLKNTKDEIIGLIGIYIDISEKKHMQDTINKKNRLLAQQAKMAALGEMLENIAHQWRQPLSLILSTASGLKLKKEYNQLNDTFLLESIENITHSVEHLNQTINDFRDYFRPDRRVRYFNLSKVVDKAIMLVESKLKNYLIEIKKEINSTDAYGFENEFIQVLMNILNNSIDEFEKTNIKDKVIVIETKELSNCEHLVKDEVCKYKCVTINIYDNAGGFKDIQVENIFKAYYTTKGEKGTGIGLYMSKEMIEDHMKGTIKASNTEFEYKGIKAKGASFTINIPSQKYD